MSYTENDYKEAAEFREKLHREALAKARQKYPDIDYIADPHSVDEYLTEHWDYPGAWYTMTTIPSGYRSRELFVDALAEASVEYYLRTAESKSAEEPFYKLLEEYPDCAVDYCIVTPEAEYNGCESHWDALMKGAEHIFDGEWELSFDIGKIRARLITVDELFAPAATGAELNYRGAFLFPPHGNRYTKRDFKKINAALFPKGTDGLEAYRWSTDWSEYFDEGREWWGTLCITVYDKAMNRFAVLMASATD